MSLRTEVLDELEQAATSAVTGIIGAIEREKLERRAEPCKWKAFHRIMVVRLPRGRLIARAWHRMRGRRYEALCEVEQASNPIACAYCAVSGGAA